MKKTKYTGLFISVDNAFYELEVYCFGFLQAFFLLTADAIRKGKHYQLFTIADEKGSVRKVDDILKCGELLS
jgi:predicted peroxiredoxin